MHTAFSGAVVTQTGPPFSLSRSKPSPHTRTLTRAVTQPHVALVCRLNGLRLCNTFLAITLEKTAINSNKRVVARSLRYKLENFRNKNLTRLSMNSISSDWVFLATYYHCTIVYTIKDLLNNSVNRVVG